MTDKFDDDKDKCGEDEARVLREEERSNDLEDRKIEDADHHRGHQGKVKITVVVNGVPTVVEAKRNELLGDVRNQALEQTGNVAQPPENWELKNEAGEALDTAKRVGNYHFGHEVTLFLSLAAGVAGA